MTSSLSSTTKNTSRRCMDRTDGPITNKNHALRDDDDDFKIKGAATRSKEAKAEDCIICLQPITERAVAAPCNHLAFDFICLVSWTQTRETCPLCNATISEIQYDWRDVDDYKTYHLRRTDVERAGRDRRLGLNARAREGGLDQGRNARGRPNQQGTSSAQPRRHEQLSEDPSLADRRKVYQQRLYSLHIGANNISGYRDFTPQDFANSASLQSRARMFLRRELQVFTYFDTDRGMRNREFVLEYIVAVLKKFDPKGADGRAEDFLSEFFQKDNARLLLHELQAWLRSPYSPLKDWDGAVQYASRSLQSVSSKGSDHG